jgi:hypothetical protein
MIKTAITISPAASNIKKPQIAMPGTKPKNNPKNPAKPQTIKNKAIHVVKKTANKVLTQMEFLSTFNLSVDIMNYTIACSGTSSVFKLYAQSDTASGRIEIRSVDASILGGKWISCKQ